MTAAQRHLFDASPDYGDGDDFWATPKAVADAIYEPLMEAVVRRNARFQVLEPAAGEGALCDLAMSLQPRRLATCEINPARHEILRRTWGHTTAPVLDDFLLVNPEQCWPGLTTDPEHPLLVLMNPPWTSPRETIGREFVQRALELAKPTQGIVCALLQLDWATGVEWSKIHDEHPASFFPLRRRPKFNGVGTGMRPAAWFIWDRKFPRREWRVVG